MEIVDLSESEKDEEAAQDEMRRLDSARSKNDIDTVRTTSGKRKAQEDHLSGPSCPICSTHLSPSTSNQDLNNHIDRCLNKDAIKDAKRTPKKAKGIDGSDTGKRKSFSKQDTAKKKSGTDRGSMMGWLKKEL